MEAGRVRTVTYDETHQMLLFVNADAVKQAWLHAQKAGKVASEFLSTLGRFSGRCFVTNNGVTTAVAFDALIASAKKTEEKATAISSTGAASASSSSSMSGRYAEDMSDSAPSSSYSFVSSSSSTSAPRRLGGRAIPISASMTASEAPRAEIASSSSSNPVAPAAAPIGNATSEADENGWQRGLHLYFEDHTDT